MNWNRKKTLLAGMAMLFALFLSRSAYADPITFTLSQPIQTGAAGTTLDFFGTITNTSATTVFLNSDNSNLTSPVLLIDDTPFFALSASLAPNASTGLVELFDVTIAANAAAGSYTGNVFQIMGGDQQNVSVDLLATQQFAVNVTSASSPEPSTIVLLAGGLAATTLKKRIHRRPS